MRKYTLVFMEQQMGRSRLTPIEGAAGDASFTAIDDDAALEYVTSHLIERVRQCVRAELSSLRIITDASSSGVMRLVDDSHENPHFQDSVLTFNQATQAIDLDFESTRTALLADYALLRSTTAGQRPR